MIFDFSKGVSAADLCIIVATVSGPILAVQAQKLIERLREHRNKQMTVFHILMATRAVRANSADHVQALNSIDLFFSKRRRRERPVIDAWSVYLDHLTHGLADADTIVPERVRSWNEESVNLLVDLLDKLAISMGYEFDQVRIRRGVYFPRGHSEEMTGVSDIRENLLRVLKGEQPLQLNVLSLPSDERLATTQT